MRPAFSATALATATLTGALFSMSARAQEPMHHAMGDRPASTCTTTTLECATAVTPFFDHHGRLWIAWSASGAVSVAHSDDDGRTFSAPVVIGRHGAMLDGGADARPQLGVDGRGRVVVAYGVFKDRRYNAQVMISTSTDGTAFSTPRSLSGDAASQRFPLLAFEPDGTLFAAWLDKRTVAAARRAGVEQPGAALATATSRDAGAAFDGERVVADHSCECCHVALAFDGERRPVLLYRAIFGADVRDHALTTLGRDGAAGPVHRVAADDWHIDGCPHHGPALAIARDGSEHAAWFTQGDARQGLFYARSDDGGATFSAPNAVGHADRQPGRPQLLAVGDDVWLAWKEFDGTTVTILERHSRDAGRTWSDDRVIGQTGAYADHPLLVADGTRVFASWLTRTDGYRLIRLVP